MDDTGVAFRRQRPDEPNLMHSVSRPIVRRLTDSVERQNLCTLGEQPQLGAVEARRRMGPLRLINDNPFSPQQVQRADRWTQPCGNRVGVLAADKGGTVAAIGIGNPVGMRRTVRHNAADGSGTEPKHGREITITAPGSPWDAGGECADAFGRGSGATHR